MTNNARNNNTYLNYLVTVFNFKKDNWRIQCITYMLNLITQSIIFKKK